MKCSKCGYENSDQDLFCVNCGNKLERRVRPKKKNKLLVILLCVVLFIGGGVFGYTYVNKSSKVNKFNATIEAAEEYLNNKDYDQAISKYLEAIEIDPKQEKAYIELADLYYEQKAFQDEINLLDNAKSNIDSEEVDIRYNIVSSVYDIMNTDTYVSGKDGDLYWSVDYDGLLIIAGMGDYEGNSYLSIFWKDFYRAINSDSINQVSSNSKIGIDGIPGWCLYNTSITSAKVAVKDITSCKHMFGGCYNMVSVDFSCFDTQNVTDMSAMFSLCGNLKYLDLSMFDTSNVTDMSSMFGNCQHMESVDVSNFNTSKVTDMNCMFNECFDLKSVDVSNFDTSNVTDMIDMFGSCKSLASVDVSNFNTSKVLYMDGMFEYCEEIKTLDVSSFDTSNVKEMACMFSNCVNLETLKMHFILSLDCNDTNMFIDCDKLDTDSLDITYQ